MKAFDDLLDVASKLNGPGGCPWDHNQTFFSLQPYVLEEAHEVVEAVDSQNDAEVIEELGDLLYVVIFYAKIAEKEGRFSIENILKSVTDKLIRRHPHVFGSTVVKTESDIEKNWEEIKKNEEGKSQRTSALDGIPDSLPSLAKAQKMMRIFLKKHFLQESPGEAKLEQEIAQVLWGLVALAEQSKVDIESAFRRKLSEEKKAFLRWEGDS
jgi:MazG family protein